MGQLPDRHRPNHAIHPVTHRPTLVFLTVCTRDPKRLLDNPTAHDAIVRAWTSAAAWRVGRYVIMPDHVHLFVTPGTPQLPLINWLKFWKRGLSTVLGANSWQDDYWDYTLRSNDSYADKWDYVRRNPERAGWVARAEDWPYQGVLNDLQW